MIFEVMLFVKPMAFVLKFNKNSILRT